MGRYRKVDPRIWNDAKFRTLSDDGKLAFLFVLTHPQMTALGAMRGTISGLAEELRWDVARMRDAMSDAIRHDMVVVNADASFICLPKFLRYNEPEGPNSVTKAWLDALDLIPECAEKADLISNCRKYLDGKSDAFRHAIGHAIWDAFGMPCPIQEQEQEQEQEEDISDLRSSVTAVFDHWRETWNHPGAKLDAKRRKRIEARLKDFTADQLCQAISGFKNSPWHCGTDPKSNGVVYDGIETLLRDTAQVEKGIALLAQPPVKPNGKPPGYVDGL